MNQPSYPHNYDPRVLIINTDAYKLKSFHGIYNSKIKINIYLNKKHTFIFRAYIIKWRVSDQIFPYRTACRHCSLACLARMIFHECPIKILGKLKTEIQGQNKKKYISYNLILEIHIILQSIIIKNNKFIPHSNV